MGEGTERVNSVISYQLLIPYSKENGEYSLRISLSSELLIINDAICELIARSTQVDFTSLTMVETTR